MLTLEVLEIGAEIGVDAAGGSIPTTAVASSSISESAELIATNSEMNPAMKIQGIDISKQNITKVICSFCDKSFQQEGNIIFEDDESQEFMCPDCANNVCKHGKMAYDECEDCANEVADMMKNPAKFITNELTENLDKRVFEHNENANKISIEKIVGKRKDLIDDRLKSVRKHVLVDKKLLPQIKVRDNLNGTYELIDGNHRLALAELLGMKELPVEFVD